MRVPQVRFETWASSRLNTLQPSNLNPISSSPAIPHHLSDLQIDYPMRIVILPAPFLTGSERSESKDLSSNFKYLQDLEIPLQHSFLGSFFPL